MATAFAEKSYRHFWQQKRGNPDKPVAIVLVVEEAGVGRTAEARVVELEAQAVAAFARAFL